MDFASQYALAVPIAAGKRAINTNIVCLRLDNLASPAPVTCKGHGPAHCSRCAAVFCSSSTLTSGGKWTCAFCGHGNAAPHKAVLKVAQKSPTVEYLLGTGSSAASAKRPPAVIFCIDISGSMCVSEEMQMQDDDAVAYEDPSEPWACHVCTLKNSPQTVLCSACATERRSGVAYVSRLAAMKKAVVNELKALAAANPKTPVGLVAFSDQVTLIGDGKSCAAQQLEGTLLDDFDGLLQLGEQSKAVSLPIKSTAPILCDQLMRLTERGQTALGPALLLSMAMAGRSSSGSRVIICTDGLSNVGVGALSPESSELEREYSRGFFTRAADYALDHGINVSVISIEGEECNLTQLGTLADQTGGVVQRVKAAELGRSVASVAAQSVLATRVRCTFVPHARFVACKNGLPLDDASLAGLGGENRPLGSVDTQSEALFHFTATPAARLAAAGGVPDLPLRAPFQVQVSYRRGDGQDCVRVFNESCATTDSREQAEQNANVAMISAFAAQTSAALAQLVEYGPARDFGLAYRELIERAGRHGSDGAGDAIYANYVSVMDQLNSEVLYEQLHPTSAAEQDDKAANAIFNLKRANTRHFRRQPSTAYDNLLTTGDALPRARKFEQTDYDNLPESASAAGYAPAGAGVDPTYDALTTMSLAMESPYANDEDTSEEALMAAAAALGIDVNAIGAEKK